MGSPNFSFSASSSFILLVLMWFTIGGILSSVSGWPRLAKRFHKAQVIGGQRFRFASGFVGASKWFPISYRQCLFLTVNDEGVGVAVFFPFRFLSPALFIPWSDVEAIEERRFWFNDHVVIKIRDSAVRIMVRGVGGEYIKKSWETKLVSYPMERSTRIRNVNRNELGRGGGML